MGIGNSKDKKVVSEGGGKVASTSKQGVVKLSASSSESLIPPLESNCFSRYYPPFEIVRAPIESVLDETHYFKNDPGQGWGRLFAKKDAQEGCLTYGISACWVLILQNMATGDCFFAHVDYEHLESDSREILRSFLAEAKRNEQKVLCCRIGKRTDLHLSGYEDEFFDGVTETPVIAVRNNCHLAVFYSSANNGTLRLNIDGSLPRLQAGEFISWYELKNFWSAGLASREQYCQDVVAEKERWKPPL